LTVLIRHHNPWCYYTNTITVVFITYPDSKPGNADTLNRNPRCQTIQVQVDITKDLTTAVHPVEGTTGIPSLMEEEVLEDIREFKLSASCGRPRGADPSWCDPGWEL
jgi:hypothetical protein